MTGSDADGSDDGTGGYSLERSAGRGQRRRVTTDARTDAESTVPEICVVTTLDRLLDDCCSHGLCETSDGQALAAGVVATDAVRRRGVPDGAGWFR